MSNLRYYSGEEIRAGDLVTCAPEGAWPGRVVVQIERGEAVDGFNIDDWSYLEHGFVVETKEAGLAQYTEADEDIEFIRRA